MRKNAMILLRITALSCLAAAFFAFPVAAPAQVQTETVNREKVPAGEATPTGASFKVQFPVSYADIIITPAEGSGPIRMVTGVSEDHIGFSASQFDMPQSHKVQPLEDFMNHVRDKSGADLSNLDHQHDGDTETLSFMLIDVSGGGSLYQVIRTASAQYVLVVQFQAAQRDDAGSLSVPFFGSFKLIGQ